MAIATSASSSFVSSSPGRLRTLEVIDETTELIVKLLGLANLPVLRGSRKRVLGLIKSVVKDQH